MPDNTQTSKSHVAKPENFSDAGQFDKFKRQAFLYVSEHKKDFDEDEKEIRFMLSYMTDGLPGKFADNFIEVMSTNPPSWGTAKQFTDKLNAAFGNQNKKSNAQNQLRDLRQGSKSAEEFFQTFDQLVRTAGYQKDHDDFLIQLLNCGYNLQGRNPSNNI
jgi:hypothetical protein